MKPSAFCALPPERIIDSSPLGLVIRYGFPISPWHTLSIPKRHVGSFFELYPEERSELLALLDQAKVVLDKEFTPQGYNIGINDGSAAEPDVATYAPHWHLCLAKEPHEPPRRRAGYARLS